MPSCVPAYRMPEPRATPLGQTLDSGSPRQADTGYPYKPAEPDFNTSDNMNVIPFRISRKGLTVAEIIIRQLIDDLDGKPIDAGLGHQVTFSYQGADYRIDLRPTNADKIEAAFAPYIKVAEKVSSAGKPRAKTSSATAPAGSGRSAEQLKAIRDWAGKNGLGVSQRGRVKAAIIDAFDAAH